jgi:ABC-type Fe3+-hydroxamate transport system substrate-binding protein
MKRKLLTLTLLTTLTLAACGNNSEVQSTKTETSEITSENPTTPEDEIASVTSTIVSEALSDITSEVKDASNIESDKNLFSIEVTLPASVDDSTDAELEELRKDKGYLSITRNKDNSITYVMTKDKQKELLEKLETRFEKFAETTPGSENYPNVTKLEVNDDFSKFTITTTATSKDKISFSETILASVFYSFGGAYRGYLCESDTSVTVEYVCESTGEVIATGNSANVE